MPPRGQSKGWDPVRKRYVRIAPDRRGRMNPDQSITPSGDVSWAGRPMTDAEAEAYEERRKRVLQGGE